MIVTKAKDEMQKISISAQQADNHEEKSVTATHVVDQDNRPSKQPNQNDPFPENIGPQMYPNTTDSTLHKMGWMNLSQKETFFSDTTPTLNSIVGKNVKQRKSFLSFLTKPGQKKSCVLLNLSFKLHVFHVTFLADPQQANVWYVSDDGSDENNCHTASTPCENLQTVLDRAEDGADIFVTSDTLSLNKVTDRVWLEFYSAGSLRSCCVINSSISYRLEALNAAGFKPTCSGEFP